VGKQAEGWPLAEDTGGQNGGGGQFIGMRKAYLRCGQIAWTRRPAGEAAPHQGMGWSLSPPPLPCSFTHPAGPSRAGGGNGAERRPRGVLSPPAESRGEDGCLPATAPRTLPPPPTREGYHISTAMAPISHPRGGWPPS